MAIVGNAFKNRKERSIKREGRRRMKADITFTSLPNNSPLRPRHKEDERKMMEENASVKCLQRIHKGRIIEMEVDS